MQSNTATDKESSRKNLLLREGYIFGLFTLSVTLFLSLISYSNDDRSFHVINSSESVANLLGSAGAYTSDILLAVFGITAFLLPLLLAIKSFQLFMSPSQKVYGSMDILVIWLRVIGFILLLVSATTFVNIHYGDFKSDYPSGLGGYIGVFLGEHVVSVFGYIGGTILLILSLIHI